MCCMVWEYVGIHTSYCMARASPASPWLASRDDMYNVTMFSSGCLRSYMTCLSVMLLCPDPACCNLSMYCIYGPSFRQGRRPFQVFSPSIHDPWNNGQPLTKRLYSVLRP